MKANGLFGLSVVLNLVLTSSTVYLWNRGSAEPSSELPAATGAPDVSKARPEAERASNSPPAVGATAEPGNASGQFDWRRVESPDYRQYIANLRNIGCPDKTIRDIITADVNELFRERARGELGATNRYEYWKSGVPFANVFNEKTVVKQQELSKEKRELLKVLLGDNAPTGWDSSSMMDTSQQVVGQMLDFLPQEKLGPLMELEQKYGAKLMETIKSAQQGDPTAMKQVLKEKDAEMLTMLSPSEKFEYDLRMSQSAMVMRMQMGDFEATEQEFREMFKARKAFDEEFGLPGMALSGSTGKEERARRQAAQKELDEQMKNALGDDRYRVYTYEQRWMNDPLRSVAKDFNLSKDNAFTVFDLQKEAEVQAQRVRQNQAMSEAQRAAALAGIRSETEQTVRQVLGPTAAQEYLPKASWIKNVDRVY